MLTIQSVVFQFLVAFGCFLSIIYVCLCLNSMTLPSGFIYYRKQGRTWPAASTDSTALPASAYSPNRDLAPYFKSRMYNKYYDDVQNGLGHRVKRKLWFPLYPLARPGWVTIYIGIVHRHRSMQLIQICVSVCSCYHHPLRFWSTHVTLSPCNSSVSSSSMAIVVFCHFFLLLLLRHVVSCRSGKLLACFFLITRRKWGLLISSVPSGW